MRKEIAVWTLLCVVVGVLTVIYLLSTAILGNKAPVMPLDDAYIHFQYARQMALGHPFVYSIGDNPTSGGTSLIYVPLLAVGYWLGFTGLSLGYWAIGIGLLSFLFSGWLIYLSIYERGGSRLIGILMMLAFTTSGAFVWAALSGMETTLFVFSVLLCLYLYRKDAPQKAVLAGVLVALVRPEGAFVAAPFATALTWRFWQQRGRIPFWGALPILASGLQPLLNFALTGSLAASGAQAKSVFYDVTIPFSQQLGRVWDFWSRMWVEFFQGQAAYGDPYVPGLIIVLALIMIVLGVKKSHTSLTAHPAALAGAWMLLMSISVATLETAFWHYKRYQLPIMALAFPLAGWLLNALARSSIGRRVSVALAAVALLISVPTNSVFVSLYQNNVLVTTNFQFALATWINANIPVNARLAVFDVGIVGYVGNRMTYDVVGLTTPQVTGAMRQGPGAVYDTMTGYPYLPDYFALYPSPRQPFTIYLMRTSTWGQELAYFEAPDVPNTTTGGSSQTIAKADWSSLESASHVNQPMTLAYLAGFRQIGMLNVGDLASERDYNYSWKNNAEVPGFLTSLDQLPYYACAQAPCTIIDGTRAINGEERFTLPHAKPEEDYLVVMRVNAAQSAQIEYGCGRTLGTRVIPEIPGNWVELVFLIPGNTEEFCTRALGTYYSARYWIYGGHFVPLQANVAPIASWDKIALLNYEIQQDADVLTLTTTWLAQDGLQGDGKLFVHLYTDPYQAPISQWDGYLQKTMPLANLLPGVFQDRVQLSLRGLPPGKYILGLGFYDQFSGKRYVVQAPNTDRASQRIFLETITLP